MKGNIPSPLGGRGSKLIKRFSVSLPQKLKEKIDQIATRDNKTTNEVMTQAAELEVYVNEFQEKGGKIYFDLDGDVFEL